MNHSTLNLILRVFFIFNLVRGFFFPCFGLAVKWKFYSYIPNPYEFVAHIGWWMSKAVRIQKINSVKYSIGFTCTVLLEAKFARTVDKI